MTKKLFSRSYMDKITFFANANDNALYEAKWLPKRIVLGSITPLSNSTYKELDNTSFGDVTSAEYFVFKMRELDGINKEMRIEAKDKWYEIKRIINSPDQEKETTIIALAIED